jgi:hypothetical protein
LWDIRVLTLDDYQRIELITGTARRHALNDWQKLRIVEASYAPGESGSLVARRHGVTATDGGEAGLAGTRA